MLSFVISRMLSQFKYNHLKKITRGYTMHTVLCITGAQISTISCILWNNTWKTAAGDKK